MVENTSFWFAKVTNVNHLVSIEHLRSAFLEENKILTNCVVTEISNDCNRYGCLCVDTSSGCIYKKKFGVFFGPNYKKS